MGPQNALHAGGKALARSNGLGLAQGVLHNGHLCGILGDKFRYHFRRYAPFNLQPFHGSEPHAPKFNLAQLAKMDAEAEASAHGMVYLINIVAYPYDTLIGPFQKCVEPGFCRRASVHADRRIEQPLGLIHQNKAVLVRSSHAQAGRKRGASVLRRIVLLAGHGPGLHFQFTGKGVGKAGFAGSRCAVEQNVYRPAASTAQQS